MIHVDFNSLHVLNLYIYLKNTIITVIIHINILKMEHSLTPYPYKIPYTLFL